MISTGSGARGESLARWIRGKPVTSAIVQGLNTSTMVEQGANHGSFARRRNSTTAGFLLAGAVSVLALPSAVLAFSSGFSTQPVAARTQDLKDFAPTAVDGHLARSLGMNGLPKGQFYRFTPAGTSMRPDRSVTVAVRVDADTARAITVRAQLPQIETLAPAAPIVAVRIAPNAYNLGVSRGYHGFAQPMVPADTLRSEQPDLASFKLNTPNNASAPSFRPRISLDQRENTGRAPRTFAGNGAESVDVGGSYRVMGNLNVTAGVRYSQEHERLAPLTDGKKDNQAVYVGTQFRF